VQPLRTEPAAPALRPWRLGVLSAVLFAGAALLLYGRHLGDALLSDDFLYANWAAEGVRTILRRTTVDSYPQMIRPIPGLVWSLSRWSHGAVLLHAVSLALHGVNACLLGGILRRAGRPAAISLLVPALFLVFPLFGEPVIWLSASFDLWACAFALLSVLAILAAAEGSVILPAGLFALALLCKESVLPLPVLLPLLLPWPKVRRPAFATAAVAAVYLAGRWLLFRGLGGYLDEQGRTLALSIRPAALANMLAVQVPSRILMPLQGAGRFAVWIAVGLAALFAGLLLTSGLWRRPAALARIAAVGLLAVLPTAPVIQIQWDLQGSRLLYFPLAMVLTAAGLELRELKRPAVAVASLLVLVWTGIAWRNLAPWTTASDEVRGTLAGLERSQAAWPPEAEVWVDAHDTNGGAYVFRNGLPEAARLRGLRQDVTWHRGTIAAAPPAPERIGQTLFEVSADWRGEPVDWTACEKALREAPLQPIATWEGRALSRRGPGRWIGPYTPVPRSRTGLAVRLALGDCPGSGTGARTGKLFWRTDGADRFTTTDFRVFTLDKDGGAILRLPPEARWTDHLQVRVDLDPAPALSPTTCGRSVTLLRSPRECRLWGK
jgi:hypothetical protein